MKKIILCILILVLVSCEQQSGESGGGSDLQSDYMKGSQGLIINFVQNNPPEQVLSSASLNVLVEVKNKGAFDVSGGNLYLSGYDKRYFFGTDQVSQAINIEGKSPYNPEGNIIQILEFKDTSIDGVPEQIDSFNQNIKATACYYYETHASPEICVNPKQYTTDSREDVCQIHPVTLSGGQGGPIEVTKIEEELMDDRILLKIQLKNAGGGTPFVGSTTNCHTSLGYQDVDIINLLEVSFSNYDLTGSCKPSPIRLTDGRGFIICNAQLDGLGSSAFKTPLQIKLGYNYRTSISKSVEVVNI